MFLAGENYTEEVKRLIDSNEHIDLAVAFWGKGSDLLVNIEGKTARIVCQLRGGGTNPLPIRILKDSGSVQVRALDTLHAKVVIGSTTAIIGSANFSTNGLGYESSQNSGWSEAGTLIRGIEDVAAAKAWFEKTWAEANEINEQMLVDAELEWKKRQRGKAPPVGVDSIFKLNAEYLKNTDIFVCVSSEDVSDQAQLLNNKYCAGYHDDTPSNCIIEPFTNWKSMRVEQKFICVSVGSRYGIKEVSGPYEVIATGRFEENGESQTIFHALLLQNEILAGLPFGSAQRSILQNAIKKDTLSTINNVDIVPISEFFTKHTNIFDKDNS